MLAVFGSQVASENDVEDAIRAGLAITENARLQAPYVREKYGLPDFQVRAGVHTGIALLGGGVETESSIRGNMSELSVLSKLNTQAAFISALHDEGRRRADAWLEANFRHIRVRSTFTLDQHLY